MDIFRRMGTNKKKFKVQFFIGRLKFSSFIKGKIYIVLKRGNHKQKSQQQLQMSKDLKLNFNKQILQMQNTLYYDQKTNKHQQKYGQLKIILLTTQNQKILLGVVRFDIAQYANSAQQSFKLKKQLQQTPKKLQGLIQYGLFVKYIGQGSVSSFDKVENFFFGKIKNKQINQTNTNNITPNQPLKQNNNIKSGSLNQPNSQTNKYDKKMKRSLSPQNDFDDLKSAQNKYNQNNQNFYYNADEQIQSNQLITNSKNSVKNISDQNKNIQVNSKQIKIKKITQQINKDQIIKNNQKMKLQIELWKQKHHQLQNSNKKQTKQLQILRKQLQNYEQKNINLSIKLKQRQQQLNKQRQQRQRQTIIDNKKGNSYQDQNKQMQQYQKLIRKIQKQKNQYIVQISKLKQKNKTQIKKYQQQINQKQQNQSQNQIQLKIFNQKLQQQNKQFKQKVFMLNKQKNQKNIELNKIKIQKRSLQDQLASVKTSLSKIKIKICSLINDSLTKGENSLADILTTLTQQ